MHEQRIGLRLCHRTLGAAQRHLPADLRPDRGPDRRPRRGDGRHAALRRRHRGDVAGRKHGRLHLLRRCRHGHCRLGGRDAGDHGLPHPAAPRNPARPRGRARHGGVVLRTIHGRAARRLRHCRKHGRRAVLFTDLERADSDGFVTDFADATTHEPIRDRDETPRLIAAELERILDPEPRVLFAAASGIVDYLPPAIVERWCGECHAVPQPLDAVVGLLGTPLHGRQAKLAAAFGLREATARKRYERSARRVAEATTIVALRDLILARRRGPSS